MCYLNRVIDRVVNRVVGDIQIVPKVKDEDIKNLTTSKKAFLYNLKKVSQKIEKPNKVVSK